MGARFLSMGWEVTDKQMGKDTMIHVVTGVELGTSV